MELISSYVFNVLHRIGDKITVIEAETNKQLSASDINDKSHQISQYLSARGFGSGDVIAYFSPNCADFVCFTLGIIDTGAAVAYGNPNFSENELIKFLSMIKPDAVVYNTNIADLILKVAGKTIKCLSTTAILSQRESFIDYIRNDQKLSDGKDHVAFILLSSGTSGFPKPAKISHHAFILQLKYCFTFHREYQRMLAVLPSYHIYGLIMILDALCQKSSIVTMSKFNAALLVDNIKKHQISILPIVPSLLLPLLDCSADDLKSLRFIFTGGAPANDSLISALLDKIPPGSLDVYNIYGMTEATGCISVLKISNSQKVNSGQAIGEILPFLNAKIITINGTVTPLTSGIIGELCLKGDNIFLGYKNNPEATEELIDQNGWLHTGDLAYRDEEDSYFIVGRIKELIKYQGNQISPYELESVFRQHPAVKEVAVVGIPHEIFGELPAAVVVPKDNVEVTTDELKQFVEGQINPAKRLRGGVYLCSSDFIPRTVSGKVKRKELLLKLDLKIQQVLRT